MGLRLLISSSPIPHRQRVRRPEQQGQRGGVQWPRLMATLLEAALMFVSGWEKPTDPEWIEAEREINTLKVRGSVCDKAELGTKVQVQERKNTACRFSASCKGMQEEDRWRGPSLPCCSPQDIPFIPSIMMGLIDAFGSKSSRVVESICYRVLLLFIGSLVTCNVKYEVLAKGWKSAPLNSHDSSDAQLDCSY